MNTEKHLEMTTAVCSCVVTQYQRNITLHLAKWLVKLTKFP